MNTDKALRIRKDNTCKIPHQETTQLIKGGDQMQHINSLNNGLGYLYDCTLSVIRNKTSLIHLTTFIYRQTQ